MNLFGYIAKIEEITITFIVSTGYFSYKLDEIGNLQAIINYSSLKLILKENFDLLVKNIFFNNSTSMKRVGVQPSLYRSRPLFLTQPR